MLSTKTCILNLRLDVSAYNVTVILIVDNACACFIKIESSKRKD